MAQPERGHGRDLPHPVLQALLLCDQAIREVGTNKSTVVGVFDRIYGPGFPLQFMRPVSVYARIMDAEGEYPIRLELVRLDDEMTIGKLDMTAVISDRMSTNDLIINIPQLIFERPGAYEWRLFANGRHVGGARLTVVQQNQVEQGGPP